MKAIVLQGEPRKVLYVTDRPCPQIRPGYIVVDVKAVALNPADWKHIDRAFLNTKGCLSGCDYAGVVVQTGEGYTKSWSLGDRVCGFVHGGNQHQPEDGAFAERIVAKADIQLRIPDEMSFEEAAALGVGVVTCGQGLFQQLGLAVPGKGSGNGERVLIYGGSSATGALGIQFAKKSVTVKSYLDHTKRNSFSDTNSSSRAGYSVVTTCSPRNFSFVKSLGAEAAFDYRDVACVSQIRAFSGPLKFVWDTISLASSAKLCSQVIAAEGTYGSIIKVELPRRDVKTTFSLGYTAIGEPVTKGSAEFPDNLGDFEFCKGWIAYVQELLDTGSLKVHPVRRLKGLDKVLDGVELLRKDALSGEKLVFVL